MIWSTNYGRLASQTLYTLFFAGRDYAPKCIIDGRNIQDYLQSHFIAAFGALADRLREAGDLFDSCVIGWDSLNEPAEGFCGYEDLNVVPSEQGSTLRKGSSPTPLQSLRLGMGQKQTVDHYSFGSFGPKKDGTVTIDPKGFKMWLDPSEEPNGVNERWGWRRDPSWELGKCIWAMHGVWDIESGKLLRPDYFKSPPFDPERPVVFTVDFWRPFWRKYVARIRAAHPEAINFVQPPVFAQPPPLDGPDDLKGRACYSGHYYDGLTLVSRHWNWFNADTLGVLRGKYWTILQALRVGEKAIRQSLQEQLGILKADAEILGPYPTLIGEIGTPFDMDGKRAYGYTDGGKHKGDYSNQEKALDASLNAADGPNAINYTIWTYCPDSSHMWGDGWNMEDLSLWSEDDLRMQEKYAMKMQMQVSDASSAALLKGKSGADGVQVDVKPVNGASTLSLDTLGGVSLSNSLEDIRDDDRSIKFKYPTPSSALNSNNPLEEHPHWANVFDFLSDGARAVRAFARPYPVATVGVVEDLSFDLQKAEFEMRICVRGEDRPVIREGEGGVGKVYGQTRGLASSSRVTLSYPCTKEGSSTTETMGAVDGANVDSESSFAELPTEIFLPVIHYASSTLLSQSVFAKAAVPEIEQDVDGELDGCAPPRGSTFVSGASTPTTPTDYTHNANIGKGYHVQRTATLASTSTATLPSPDPQANFANALHPLSAAHATFLSSSPVIDVDVQVSAGRWEVDGQVLKWWHPVPVNEDADELVHTIRVKRRGGVIKTKNETAQTQVQTQSSKRLCERLCPSDMCTIM